MKRWDEEILMRFVRMNQSSEIKTMSGKTVKYSCVLQIPFYGFVYVYKCNSYLIHTDINQVIKAALNEGRSEPYSTKMKWPLLRLSHISALLVHDCSQVLKESRRWWIVHCRSHSPISHTVIYFIASIGSIYNCQPLWAMASFFLLSSAFSYLFFSTYAFYSSFCEFRFLFYLFKTSLK